jgi:ubiquinone/menaquinone biosynthesis C-methylase UbiE
MEHSQQIERAFTTQAEAFEDASRNRVVTSDARWVFERLALTGEDVVLDVAAGTGHAARQLAAIETHALLTGAGLEEIDLATAAAGAAAHAVAGAGADRRGRV